MGHAPEKAGVVLAELDHTRPLPLVHDRKAEVLLEQVDALLERRFGKQLARGHVVPRLAEDPGIDDRAPADHHRIAARVVKNPPDILRRDDVAVDNDRNGDGFFHPGNPAVVHVPLVSLVARAAVDGQCTDP